MTTFTAQRTRGPWRVQESSGGSFGPARIVARDSHLGWMYIADVYPPHNGEITRYSGERDANALLMTAAPELLHALKELRATFGAAVSDHGSDALLITVDAAIAAAEGR